MSRGEKLGRNFLNIRRKKNEENIQRKDILWGVGSREEIGISGRGNFPSFLSLFKKGEEVWSRKKVFYKKVMLQETAI